MEEVTLGAAAGRDTGSRAARRLRSQGKVPAVLYGHGVRPQALAVDRRDLRTALTGEAGLNALITLEVEGDRHLAMVRQPQRDAVRGVLTHVDFVIVRRDEVVSAEVPVNLVGEATEVVRADGVVDQPLFSLTVQAKPADIPPSIEVDISDLSVGQTVRVGDLGLPPGVATELDAEEPVVVGQPPQAVEVPEAAEAEEAERAEAAGEVVPEPAEGEGSGSGAGEASGS